MIAEGIIDEVSPVLFQLCFQYSFQLLIGPSDDEKTSEFLGRLDDVSSKFISYRSVCIKVENGSATCNQFSQIYPVFLVPSVYYINSLTGVNLEATGGDDVSQAKLEACLEKAMKSIQVKIHFSFI